MGDSSGSNKGSRFSPPSRPNNLDDENQHSAGSNQHDPVNDLFDSVQASEDKQKLRFQKNYQGQNRGGDNAFLDSISAWIPRRSLWITGLLGSVLALSAFALLGSISSQKANLKSELQNEIKQASKKTTSSRKVTKRRTVKRGSSRTATTSRYRKTRTVAPRKQVKRRSSVERRASAAERRREKARAKNRDRRRPPPQEELDGPVDEGGELISGDGAFDPPEDERRQQDDEAGDGYYDDPNDEPNQEPVDDYADEPVDDYID